MAFDPNHPGLYVPFTDFRDAIIAARGIQFSVKAIRDHTITNLNKLLGSGRSWGDIEAGYYVEMLASPLSRLLQHVIAALDLGKATADRAVQVSYNNQSVAYFKGLMQIATIIATPVGPVATFNGIVHKT